VDELFQAIIAKIPAPTGDADAPLKALVYDAKPDVHRGVVCHVRVKEGSLRRGDKILLMAAERTYNVSEIGKFNPKPRQVDFIAAGEVGYVVAGKDPSRCEYRGYDYPGCAADGEATARLSSSPAYGFL
jgi:GTP-binding protein LepA